MEDESIINQIAFYKKFFESMSQEDFKTVTKDEVLEMLSNFEQSISDSSQKE